MKKLPGLFMAVLMLILGLITPAAAQEDNPFSPLPGMDMSLNSFSITPDAAPIGTSVTFEGDYEVSNPGTDQAAVCFYFKAGDEDEWSANFPALGSIAGVNFSKYPSDNLCAPVANYGSVGFYAADTSPAGFGDTFTRVVVVPAVSSGTGSKIVGVRYFEGSDCDGSGGTNDIPGGSACPAVNQNSDIFTIQAASAEVYAAADAAGCSGYSPCFTSLSGAYDAVGTGGTIYIHDDMPAENITLSRDLTLDSRSGGSITGASGGQVIAVNGGASVTLQNLEINAGAADDLIDLSGATLTVRGCALRGGSLAFDGPSGTLVGYANNITGWTGGTDFEGTLDLRHNWWGSGASAGTIGDSDAYDFRLGAAVESWGEGSLGGASLLPGSGSGGPGIIVSHGRGSDNAPFGKATIEDGNTQCSDYYDFFPAPHATASEWNVDIPIDSGSGCDFTYNNRQLFVFKVDPADGKPLTGCDGGECWEDLKDTSGETVTQMGRSVGLRWSSASTLELGGTPLISGNQDGTDPTLIQVRALTVSASRNTWLPYALAGASLLLAGSLYLVRPGREDKPGGD